MDGRNIKVQLVELVCIMVDVKGSDYLEALCGKQQRIMHASNPRKELQRVHFCGHFFIVFQALIDVRYKFISSNLICGQSQCKTVICVDPSKLYQSAIACSKLSPNYSSC